MPHRPTRSSRTSDYDAIFEHLYSTHHRAVLAYCVRRTSRSDAWDAAAEVFLVAWRRISDVPPPDEARAWLFGVAYRVLANQRRTAQRKLRLIERASGEGNITVPWADEPLIRGEEEAEIMAALSRLRRPDREIVQLALWEELTPTEIAGVLGISRAAVDQRYSRAKRRLAGELDRHRLIGRRATRPTTEKGGAT